MIVDDLEKNLVFSVAKGSEKNLGLIFSLRCVSKDYLKILMYCKKNNIVGKRFTQAFEEHQSSPVRFMSTMLRYIHTDKNRRATVHDLH